MTIMNRSPTIISTATNGNSKEDFINHAHEARQARELARRCEKSATIIQASLRSYLVRKQLKKDTIREFHDSVNSSTSLSERDLLLLLKKLLFVCHRDRDKETIATSLRFIVSQLVEHDTNESSLLKTLQQASDNSDQGQDVSKKSVDTSAQDKDEITSTDKHTSSGKLELAKVLSTATPDAGQLYHDWLDILKKIVGISIYYLNTKSANLSILDSPDLNIYLDLINKLTSIPDSEPENTTPGCPSKISEELFNQILDLEKNFFNCLSGIICESFNKIRPDLKHSILLNYTQLVLRRIHQDFPIKTNIIADTIRKESAAIILSMLSIPGFIYHLNKFSNEALKELNKQSLFSLSIHLLVENSDFQKLTSTSSMCLLANLVHLSSLNEDDFVQNKLKFANLTVKLLESCQKNMLHISSSAKGAISKVSNKQSNRKKNESKDVSFNPLLGWLAREQAISIDKDIIKLQLSHLWSAKYIKILLSDLNKFNSNFTTNQNNSNKTQVSVLNSKIKTGLSKSNNQNQIICDNNLSSPNSSLFKRAIERVTSSMSRTLSCSYTKTMTTSSNSGISKLMSAEANRISLVCCMLHKVLTTLSTLRQEILNALCLHEYILPNLWIFICNLGPQNGLKAFLEHLTICTKTNAPEFYILILFFECASHLISILDDTELYEKQTPFSLEDLIAISAFLNNFVFGIISNNLITINSQDMDPLLRASHKLLTDLYKRDCRRKFSPQDHWLIKDIKMSVFLKDLDAGKAVAKTIMTFLPHIIPHKERVIIFRNTIAKDRALNSTGLSTLITIHRCNIVEDGYFQLARLQPQALKGLIRVKFINDLGLDEAGIDQDGVFKEFLEDTIKKVFDSALNLFCSTSEQRLYPSPTARLDENYLSLFNFVGKMLGKAIYEGIVVDVPFASFFLSRVLGQPQAPLYSPIDELPSLDPELYKSLTYIKHYEGDVGELELTFSIDHDFLGKIETYELEPGGKSIPVTRETRVRYIHSVANFRMKTQIEKQTEAFVAGFKSIINLEWLAMFSTSEFQRIISGDTAPIDLQDLRQNTKYFGGFHNNHRVVSWLWDILEKDYTPEEHSLFLKFVTSCSKPPLLGFANLEPKFSIRCVEVGDDQDLGDTVGSVIRGYLAIRRSDPVDRLPTSSTCFNMLKLPNYQRRSTLRDKLRYAIKSNPGFELS